MVDLDDLRGQGLSSEILIEATSRILDAITELLPHYAMSRPRPIGGIQGRGGENRCQHPMPRPRESDERGMGIMAVTKKAPAKKAPAKKAPAKAPAKKAPRRGSRQEGSWPRRLPRRRPGEEGPAKLRPEGSRQEGPAKKLPPRKPPAKEARHKGGGNQKTVVKRTAKRA